MKIHTFYSDCLSYEQLASYASDKSTKSERASVYKHISTCELCSCAVNGFTAIPFTSAELVAIHREIDVRTNATHKSPLTFAQVFIVLLSLGSIFAVYSLSESVSREYKGRIVSAPSVSEPSNPVHHEKKTELQKEISVAAATYKKIVAVIRNEQFQRNIQPLEELDPIRTDAVVLNEAISAVAASEVTVPYRFNSDVIYIYDLKVADYNNLYFARPGMSLPVNTPSVLENEDAAQPLETELSETVPANRVLKSGLEYFTKGKFRKASAEFRQLIAVNPDDVNAQFYNAVCLYNLGKYESAGACLQKVLASENNVFHQEAKWNLALVMIRKGDKAASRQLLTEIASEKSFYSVKAKEKLRSL